MEALNVRFVSGELSMSDYIAAVRDHADTLPPAGPPVQEYFTSFDELEAARRADDGKGAS